MNQIFIFEGKFLNEIVLEFQLSWESGGKCILLWRAGQDSRRTIGQMRTSRLRKCQFFILCKYIWSISILDGSPSDVIGCSPERRYDHRSMGRKWIGGNIFPYSFQIGQAGEAANVDIGWKRQNNKKTGQCFFFPCIPVSNVAVRPIIDLYDIISF